VGFIDKTPKGKLDGGGNVTSKNQTTTIYKYIKTDMYI